MSGGQNTETVESLFNNASRIVVKVGSDFVADKETGKANFDQIRGLAQDVKLLQERGKDVIVVASGAVALGRLDAEFELDQPLNVPQKQEAASWGNQHHSMAFYSTFKEYDVRAVTSVLVEPKHFTEDDEGANLFRRSMEAVLRKSGVPVINENDPIVTRELLFGNNDVLAADVTNVMNADLMVILSDVDGLYTKNPAKYEDAEHIPYVEEVTEEIEKLAEDSTNGRTVGGMKSKITAVKNVFEKSHNAIIARGVGVERPIQDLLSGESKATCFVRRQIA